jgi:ferritin
MIGERMQKALNEQLNNELYAGYLYFSMSSHFAAEGLSGISNWLRMQALEEASHAMKFHDHIIERGGRVSLMEVKKPKTTWKNPLEAFEDAYEHECKVTKMIDDLAALSEAEGDKPANNMLMWFVDEQVEEEKSALDIVKKLKMLGDHPGALYMLDSELGKRRANTEEKDE